MSTESTDRGVNPSRPFIQRPVATTLLMLAILLAAVLRPSKWNIVVILGVVYWPRYARVIRGEVLSLKERDYVRLAIVAGCSRWKIMWTHLLPNIANSAVVLMTLLAPSLTTSPRPLSPA